MSGDEHPTGRLGRRRFLTGAGGFGLALGVAGTSIDTAAAGQPTSDAETDVVAFQGAHQAGIATTPQDHLNVAAFDLTTDRRQDVAELLRTWTAAAARLTAGQPVAELDEDLLVPPVDTGETIGSGAARLTLTFGFGAGLFSHGASDRYGLAAARPARDGRAAVVRGRRPRPGAGRR